MAQLTAAERAQLTANLTDAQAQYHLLITGQGVAQTRDQNGETITYSITKAPELAAYIASLQSQLGLSQGRARRPASVYFGR